MSLKGAIAAMRRQDQFKSQFPEKAAEIEKLRSDKAELLEALANLVYRTAEQWPHENTDLHDAEKQARALIAKHRTPKT